MILAQSAGPQRLARAPEPAALTEALDNVVQYDRVMTTKLVLAYAASLTIVHRARSGTGSSGTALDLACGPGHYTLCLARYLRYQHVTGMDLSPRMIETATQNVAEQGLTKYVDFQIGDVTNLKGVPTDHVDLASFTDAAHHMSELETVACVLREMDRITKPQGLIMVTDLVRLRTAKLTERYVNTLGHDYVQRGLPDFFQDFRNSMYAAWTPDELRQAIPTQTGRYWCHILPRGLPTLQVILGLPVGRRRVFMRSGLPWPPDQNPVPKEMRAEWRMLRMTLHLARRWLIPPRQAAPA